MATMITDSQHYTNIADAIRTILQTNQKYKPSQMADAIMSFVKTDPKDIVELSSNGLHRVKDFEYANVQVSPAAVVSGTLYIDQKGIYDATEYAKVEVNTPDHPVSGTLTIKHNEDGIDVSKYEKVNIQVPPEITSTGIKEIKTNGTHTVIGYAQVDVNVPTGEESHATGTIEFITNTEDPVDITYIQKALVNVPPSAVVEGDLSIITNGQHDVTNYATVTVNVPPENVDKGMKTIVVNGKHDVVGCAQVDVHVPQYQTSGKYSIHNNGTYDVSRYSEVEIDVSPYLNASGNLLIDRNGQAINVAPYRTVTVDVPASVTDHGTLNIVTNGEHDVVGYEKVNIQVPIENQPTGTLTITENGEYDISKYEKVIINITPPGVSTDV